MTIVATHRCCRAAADRAAAPQKIIMTLLLSVFLVYTFIPLVYLVLSSTKNNGDLFSTFGFWFGTEFSLSTT